MVVASPNPTRKEKIQAVDLPIIDLSAERSQVRKLIVKACEDYGFFKVINHGVPKDIIAKVEEQSLSFFAQPVSEKQRAGPSDPFGYGGKMTNVRTTLVFMAAAAVADACRWCSMSVDDVGRSVGLGPLVRLGKDGYGRNLGWLCQSLFLGFAVPRSGERGREKADPDYYSSLIYPIIEPTQVQSLAFGTTSSSACGVQLSIGACSASCPFI